MVKEKRGGTHATITSMILENIYDTREHKANFNDMIRFGLHASYFILNF